MPGCKHFQDWCHNFLEQSTKAPTIILSSMHSSNPSLEHFLSSIWKQSYQESILWILAKSPPKEISSPKRLIYLLLEDLDNKSLHANICGQRYKTWNSCIKDAIDFDDVYVIYGNVDKQVTNINRLVYYAKQSQYSFPPPRNKKWCDFE